MIKSSLLLALALVGCVGPKSPEISERSKARACILSIAEAVEIADVECARVAVFKDDEKIADACSSAYDVARVALISAEDMLDANASKGASCAAKSAVDSLVMINRVLWENGAQIPPAVQDGLVMVDVLFKLIPCEGK